MSLAGTHPSAFIGAILHCLDSSLDFWIGDFLAKPQVPLVPEDHGWSKERP